MITQYLKSNFASKIESYPGIAKLINKTWENCLLMAFIPDPSGGENIKAAIANEKMEIIQIPILNQEQNFIQGPNFKFVESEIVTPQIVPRGNIRQ